MLTNYMPIMVFFVLAILFGFALLAAGFVLAPRRPDAAKSSPYECGFPPSDNARGAFNIRFYLVAILFIIFDLETAFLVPWAVTFRQIGWFGLGAMGIFLGMLVIGFIYEWKKGALEWE